MSGADLFLPILIAGMVIGTALLVVAVVKTVRHHGWGQQQWAPPAVPWFVAGFIAVVAGLLAAFTVANGA